MDETSESLPPDLLDKRPGADEFDLFFLGTGGKTFAGSSVRTCL